MVFSQLNSLAISSHSLIHPQVPVGSTHWDLSRTQLVREIFTPQHPSCSHSNLQWTYKPGRKDLRLNCTMFLEITWAWHSPWCGSEHFEKVACCGFFDALPIGIHRSPGDWNYALETSSVALSMPREPGDAMSNGNWAKGIAQLLLGSLEWWMLAATSYKFATPGCQVGDAYPKRQVGISRCHSLTSKLTCRSWDQHDPKQKPHQWQF